MDSKKEDLLKGLEFWDDGNASPSSPPLAFVKLPVMTSPIAIDILKLFDVLYGNTDQDICTWATEYQLLTRMLIHHGYLLFNPRHLDLTEVFELVYGKLCMDENKNAFKTAQTLSAKEIWHLYMAPKSEGK